MNVRRVVTVGLVVATGIVATGSSVGASTQQGTPVSAELGLSAKSTKPLTKAQFITQADALCNAAQTALVPVAQQFANLKNSSPGSPEVAAFIAAYAPILQNQINQTRALKPPKRDQSKIAKFLSTNQNELNALKADPQLLASKQSPFLTADSLARAYGLQGAAGSGPCTKPGGGGASSSPSSS